MYASPSAYSGAKGSPTETDPARPRFAPLAPLAPLRPLPASSTISPPAYGPPAPNPFVPIAPAPASTLSSSSSAVPGSHPAFARAPGSLFPAHGSAFPAAPVGNPFASLQPLPPLPSYQPLGLQPLMPLQLLEPLQPHESPLAPAQAYTQDLSAAPTPAESYATHSHSHNHGSCDGAHAHAHGHGHGPGAGESCSGHSHRHGTADTVAPHSHSDCGHGHSHDQGHSQEHEHSSAHAPSPASKPLLAAYFSYADVAAVAPTPALPSFISGLVLAFSRAPLKPVYTLPPPAVQEPGAVASDGVDGPTRAGAGEAALWRAAACLAAPMLVRSRPYAIVLVYLFFLAVIAGAELAYAAATLYVGAATSGLHRAFHGALVFAALTAAARARLAAAPSPVPAMSGHPPPLLSTQRLPTLAAFAITASVLFTAVFHALEGLHGFLSPAHEHAHEDEHSWLPLVGVILDLGAVAALSLCGFGPTAAAEWAAAGIEPTAGASAAHGGPPRTQSGAVDAFLCAAAEDSAAAAQDNARAAFDAVHNPAAAEVDVWRDPRARPFAVLPLQLPSPCTAPVYSQWSAHARAADSAVLPAVAVLLLSSGLIHSQPLSAPLLRLLLDLRASAFTTTLVAASLLVAVSWPAVKAAAGVLVLAVPPRIRAAAAEAAGDAVRALSSAPVSAASYYTASTPGPAEGLAPTSAGAGAADEEEARPLQLYTAAGYHSLLCSLSSPHSASASLTLRLRPAPRGLTTAGAHATVRELRLRHMGPAKGAAVGPWTADEAARTVRAAVAAALRHGVSGPGALGHVTVTVEIVQ